MPLYLWMLWHFCGSLWLHADDGRFGVVVYNVENLFDVDGVALFDDYSQSNEEESERYTERKLLTKLESITAVLKTLNNGAGPDVILFQELEADFTPETTVRDYQAFLQSHAEISVREMLTDGWKPEFAGLPADAWLMKALSDEGMEGYEVAVARSKGLKGRIAHANAVFSRFPISKVETYPTPEARDILEVVLNVDGAELVLFNNHWKSGASNPEREPTRVRNAQTLRSQLDEIFQANPLADVIVGGDLNSHYNHSILYPTIETGINDVLGSQGAEGEMLSLDGPDLYNLWFELPAELRYSEVWRGRRGTLMHILLGRGLYDNYGVRYVDGSFRQLKIPDVSIDALGRPLKWQGWGNIGNGASDHLPIYAEFERVFGKAGQFETLKNPSSGTDALAYEMPHGFSLASEKPLPNASELTDADDEEISGLLGHVYFIEGALKQGRPLVVEVEERDWPVYVPSRDLFEKLSGKADLSEVSLIGTLAVWRGKPQLVIETSVD